MLPHFYILNHDIMHYYSAIHCGVVGNIQAFTFVPRVRFPAMELFTLFYREEEEVRLFKRREKRKEGKKGREEKRRRGKRGKRGREEGREREEGRGR